MDTQSSAPVGIPGPQSSLARLPRFWAVARRRWPVLVILPLLALGLAGYNYKHAAKSYTAVGEATVTDLSPQPPVPQGYANYYRDLASEAASDDFVRVVPGSVFAQAVSKRLQAKGQNYSPGEVQGALTATRVFRALTVNATSGDPNRAVAIDQAALDELADNGPSYFPNRPVALSIINYPTGAAAKSLKAGVLAVGTFLAGLIAAAAIALIVELFDTRLHDRREIEDQLGVPVVGTIPRGARPERAA
jgi:capsular polysaccharide biosynthesis protein